MMASAIFRFIPRITKTVVPAFHEARVPVVLCASSWGSTSAPSNSEPPFPAYQERVGEEVELMRSRLLYQSRKRGMLENGLLLSTFASQHLDKLNQSQLKMYDSLINKPTNDWEIYYWITGAKEVPEEFNHEVFDMLKEHAKNSYREQRIRQPDL